MSTNEGSDDQNAALLSRGCHDRRDQSGRDRSTRKTLVSSGASGTTAGSDDADAVQLVTALSLSPSVSSLRRMRRASPVTYRRQMRSGLVPGTFSCSGPLLRSTASSPADPCRSPASELHRSPMSEPRGNTQSSSGDLTGEAAAFSPKHASVQLPTSSGPSPGTSSSSPADEGGDLSPSFPGPQPRRRSVELNQQISSMELHVTERRQRKAERLRSSMQVLSPHTMRERLSWELPHVWTHRSRHGRLPARLQPLVSSGCFTSDAESP